MPRKETADIRKVVRHALALGEKGIADKKIQVQTRFADDVPLLQIDAAMLEQAFLNLILNAGGAMPDGGKLAVSTESVDAAHVRITFTDSGCGIPAESLEKIFEPFYTTKARGTGLGLAITRQIIDQHHGEISIDSTIGVGTRVTVTLPIEREEL